MDKKPQRAFTFIELILVIVLIGSLFALVGFRTGAFTFWREEGFIRKFAETIQFLHNQAVSDQTFYKIELDLKKNEFVIGVLKDDTGENAAVSQLSGSVGVLTLELTALLNPTLGYDQTLIPPPSFPSLAKPEALPPGMRLDRVRTMRGVQEAGDGKAYITFSPRGFSEFAVIHMNQSTGAPVTFLVNPFTGLVEIFRDDRDFEWAYTGGDKKDAKSGGSANDAE